MITIDGSLGEAGGQVLRTSLTLSMMTGRPFRIEKIRAGRKKPGLLRQHLTAVRAATEICSATVQGDELGSQSLIFEPGEVRPGEYEFSVGTAGSAMLVLQTILLPLVHASKGSQLLIKGGTHASNAPPFEFVDRVFLPILKGMGARVELELLRHGFYPAGGGEVRATISPLENGKLEALDLMTRGAATSRSIRALVAHLPRDIGQREVTTCREALGWERHEARAKAVKDSMGPGNILMAQVDFENVTELVSQVGTRGVRSETVAERCVKELQTYLESEAPVGGHLADQLLLPMALGSGGRFCTVELTTHTTTQLELIPKFIDVELRSHEQSPNTWRVEVDVNNA